MRILLFAGLCLITGLITSCGSSAGFNPTVFPYVYSTEKMPDKAIKKVILAPVNLGPPPPSHLRKQERKLKAMVKAYLESNGFEVLPNYHFKNAWQAASRSYGSVYDPSTGKINVNAWRGAMVSTAETLRKQTDAQAIIFADLFEHDIQHSFSMQHHARWYGVNRKPSLKGSGNGVPVDFDWGQQIKAASLLVTIYDTNLDRLFVSRGGIEVLQAVDLKSSTPSFVRRKKVLGNKGHIEEGIEIAFHPFITMKKYPGNKD